MYWFFLKQDGTPKKEKVALPIAGLGSGIKVLTSRTAVVETASGDSCCVG